MNSKRVSDKIIRQLSTVRHKKVKALKSRIISGKYTVNSLEIAKALFLAQ